MPTPNLVKQSTSKSENPQAVERKTVQCSYQIGLQHQSGTKNWWMEVSLLNHKFSQMDDLLYCWENNQNDIICQLP